MKYKSFIKKFNFGADFAVPAKLVYEDMMAKPLTRSDLEADLEAVNSSIKIIRKTRGGSWPEDEVSEDYDLLDLAWHEREFRENSSFAYVIYGINSQYIGCFYLYPLGHRTELTEELLAFEVDASWWVTAAAYEQGYYEKLYNALQQWLAESFTFKKVHYSNKDIPSSKK